jgi:hypothetical protein
MSNHSPTIDVRRPYQLFCALFPSLSMVRSE